MMLQRFFFSCILVVLSGNIYGQTDMPNIVPPSPEAASVFKFNEIPVSLYTGLPNITIPLFEIESGGVKVPISLSYHARGIKIAEIASRVGLGWTLNAGGMVSRQIRNKIDAGYKGYYDTYTNSSGVVDFFNSPSTRANIQAGYTGVPESEYDFLPDQYYYNTGTGLSGKFIYDYADKSIIDQKFSDLKIISPNKIIDAEGNTYYLSVPDNDRTGYNYVFKESGNYIRETPPSAFNENTWHLSKILTKNGQEILFSYDNETTKYFRRSFDKKAPNEFNYNSQTNNSSAIESNQNRITEISFNEGKILFDYSSQTREDLIGGNYLRSVTLVDKSGQVVQTKVLKYFYTNNLLPGPLSDSSFNMNDYLKDLDSAASKRLFLSSVQTVGKNGQDLQPPYKFEYDQTKLPSRHSNAQDVWGFYNGAKNGQFLSENYPSIGTRTVDESKSGAGILKRIVFPEGGSTNFYYEQNKVYSNYPTDKVFFSNPNPWKKGEGAILSTMEYTMIDSLTLHSIYNPSARTFTKRFIVPKTLKGKKGEYKLDLSNSLNCGFTANQNNFCGFEVSIYNQRTDKTEFLYITPTTPANSYREIPLEYGTYILEVHCRNQNYSPSNHADSFIVSINWDEYTDAEEGILYAAGKRIQKIEYRDAEQKITQVKTYNYNDPASGLSSGRMFGLPNFLGIRGQVGAFTVLEPFGNTAGTPLSTYQEFSLGYETVTEYIGDKDNNIGKSVYKFTMTPESNDFYSFPYHPPPDHEWIRGKELTITHYKKTGVDTTYTEVRRIENNYTYAGIEGPGSLYSLPYRVPLTENLYCPDPSSGEPIMLQCTYSGYEKNKKMFRLPLSAIYYMNEPPLGEYVLMYKVFHLTGGAVDLNFTKVTDTFENGTVQSQTNYFYDYNHHYNVASIDKIGSNGITSTTKYFYAGDMEMEMHSAPSLLALRTKNMLNVPLVTQTFRNNSLTSSTETTYRNWRIGDPLYNPADLNGALLLPEFIKKSKSVDVIANPSATMETLVQYNKVDYSTGNPLEVQQTNGMKVSYIWQFNKNYLKAKVENASYEEIAAFLGISETDLRDGNISSTQIDQLRSGLQAAMITSYTYSPLVGITSITDPKGYTTRYTYDSFNRLEFVKDHNNKILTENEYFYAAPTN